MDSAIINVKTGEVTLRAMTPEEEADFLAERDRFIVPESVSRFQARMALRNAGLFDAVEAVMTDSATPIIAREAWETGQEFRWMSPTVRAMAAALGLSDQQLAELFIAAGGIEA